MRKLGPPKVSANIGTGFCAKIVILLIKKI